MFEELQAHLVHAQERIEAGDLIALDKLEARSQAALHDLQQRLATQGMTPDLVAAIPLAQAALDRVVVLLASAKLETETRIDDVRHERRRLGGYRPRSSRTRSARDWTA